MKFTIISRLLVSFLLAALLFFFTDLLINKFIYKQINNKFFLYVINYVINLAAAMISILVTLYIVIRIPYKNFKLVEKNNEIVHKFKFTEIIMLYFETVIIRWILGIAFGLVILITDYISIINIYLFKFLYNAILLIFIITIHINSNCKVIK